MGKNYVRIEESKKGKRITELVRGSINYLLYELGAAFELTFPAQQSGEERRYWHVEEAFDNHVIVAGSVWRGETWQRDPEKVNEYYRVAYTREGEEIRFAAREEWQAVEMGYQQRQAIDESSAWLMEANASRDGARKIRINRLMTAGIINGNGRRYRADVLREAVEELRTHLHESAGQGRLMLLGELEHPSDKGARRASLLETVIRWTEVEFDGTHVNATGLLATNTEGGRHIEALAQIGVAPGGSIRGNGLTEWVTESGQRIEDVRELHITGIDLVTEPSFTNQSILESAAEDDDAPQEPTEPRKKTMNPKEQLKLLLKARPDLVRGLSESQIDVMTDDQAQDILTRLQEALSVDLSKIQIDEALNDLSKKAAAYEAAERQRGIDAAIEAVTKELPYGAEANTAFVESIRAAKPADAAAVPALVEAKRKEYDRLFAAPALAGMGFSGRISGVAPVLESQTGTPEYARAAFTLEESIRRVNNSNPRNWNDTQLSVNERFAKRILERFDELHRVKLMRESRMLAEAEGTSDLDLPYSVSRAIVAEAFPTLVATGIFDVGIQTAQVEKIWYEEFVGEGDYTDTVTDEAVTGVLDTWVALANKRLTPGTVVVTNNAGNTTYAEGTDYVIDYEGGRIMALDAALVAALKVDYEFTGIRKGEMVGIERGKIQLSSKTLEMMADRLATQISREAIVFSRSQLGYDAVAGTLASLGRQVARKIDQGLIYKAIAAVRQVANNSGGAWVYDETQDSLAALVRYLGVARVKVSNRYYNPTFILASETNGERLSHWDGFTAAGVRPGDARLPNGLVGSVNGRPVFTSTEMDDSIIVVGNRQLVIHRVFQPMTIFGPYHTSDENGLLVAAPQYYGEEFNGSDAPVPQKGSYVTVSEDGS